MGMEIRLSEGLKFAPIAMDGIFGEKVYSVYLGEGLTALIASVSHMLIEPTIIYECREFLFIAVVVATLFSLISAKFANKVNGKIVGYVTGVTLLVLGLSMIVMNNLEKINMKYLLEFLKVFGIYIGYIVIVRNKP